MQYVILDFDGVLVDSFGFHLAKVNELYGIGLTPEEYRDVHNGNFYESGLEKFKGIDLATTPASSRTSR